MGQPDQKAAAIMVGAKQVIAADRRKARGEILRSRIILDHHRSEEGEKAKHDEQDRAAEAAWRQTQVRMGSRHVGCRHLTLLSRGSSHSASASAMAVIATNIKPIISAVPWTIGMSRSTMACTSAWPMPG
ncbi:hypothetical protein D3C87_1670070 [compost metagenome]